MVNMRPNRVKNKLAAGECVTVMMEMNDPDLIDQLGDAPFDGVWLEAEHGRVDISEISNLTRACDLWGKTSIVRVNSHDYGLIYRTLDRGAQGIVAPHVNNRAEAEAIVRAAKFAPEGMRGMFTSRQGIGVQNYLDIANDHTLVIILIEDIEAVRNLDEILEVDEIDVFFVAPGDLAQTMGHIGDAGHPEVQEVIESSIRKIAAADHAAGMVATEESVGQLREWGARFFTTTMDPWVRAGIARFTGLTNS